MCKSDFRFALFFRDIKNNVRFIPLAFVIHKVKLVFRHAPNNFFAWNKFCDLLFGAVHIFVTVRELCAEFVGVTLDFS